MRLRNVLVAMAALLAAGAASGQEYPERPVRLIVPFPPGGPTDVVARVVAEGLRPALGQQVVVENRPGAGGSIGSAAVATAPPDGYTLLLASTSTLAINPALYNKLPYDPAALEPVAVLASSPLVLVVNPSVPAKSVAEFVASAKASPGKMNYGSAGLGTTTHLAAEMFKAATGTDIVHVPFRGGGPALTAVLAGDVQLTFEVVSVVLPFVRDGKMRPLVVTGEERHPEFPDLPTMAENGHAGFNATSWFGIVAPAGTPQAILDRLNRDLNGVLKRPAMQDTFGKLGLKALGGDRKSFADRLVADSARWGGIVKATGVKLD